MHSYMSLHVGFVYVTDMLIFKSIVTNKCFCRMNLFMYAPQHGAASGTRVRANTSMLVLVHAPGSWSAALAAESLLNTGKCRCDAGKVYVRCLYRR